MTAARTLARATLLLPCALLLVRGADIPRTLTMAEALRIAEEENPLILAARDEIQMREGDVVQANKRLNPAFTFNNESYPYFSSNAGPYFQKSEITTRFDYEIETRGRRKLRTEAARRAVEAQESAYADRIRQVRLEVQRAFYQAVLAKSNLKVARSVLKQTDEVIGLNKVRYEQGAISELELRRVEVERLRFVDDVFRLELDLSNAKSALLALLNAGDLGQDIEVSGKLPVSAGATEPGLPPKAPFAELMRLAMTSRPDLKAAVAEQSRIDSETRRQRAIRSPNVTVGGGYKRNGPDNSLVFGVTVPLRIFNRNQGGILRAEAETTRAGHLAQAVRKRIQLDLQQAFNAVEINRRRVRYIEDEHLEKAKETNTVTLAAYRLGGATLIEYLDAARRYSDTVRTYNQSLYDERISLYALAGAIGIGGK